MKTLKIDFNNSHEEIIEELVRLTKEELKETDLYEYGKYSGIGKMFNLEVGEVPQKEITDDMTVGFARTIEEENKEAVEVAMDFVDKLKQRVLFANDMYEEFVATKLSESLNEEITTEMVTKALDLMREFDVDMTSGSNLTVNIEILLSAMKFR